MLYKCGAGEQLQAINCLLITNVLGKLKSNTSKLKYLKLLGQKDIKRSDSISCTPE